MTEHHRGKSLTPADLPRDDADWMEITGFALTFDGYDYAASLHPEQSPTSAAQRIYEEV